jgi:hypothetical protein
MWQRTVCHLRFGPNYGEDRIIEGRRYLKMLSTAYVSGNLSGLTGVGDLTIQSTSVFSLFALRT